MDNLETLDGGREGKIKKNGDKVIRPANEWSADVHKFLMYIIRTGGRYDSYLYVPVIPKEEN